MNLANNIFFWLILAVLLTGCASTDGTTEWLGHSEKELVATLGEPDNVAKLPDGRKILTWETYQHPAQVIPCRDSYTIDPDGYVEGFVASGYRSEPVILPIWRSKYGILDAHGLHD